MLTAKYSCRHFKEDMNELVLIEHILMETYNQNAMTRVNISRVSVYLIAELEINHSCHYHAMLVLSKIVLYVHARLHSVNLA
jgi:hypothetical protein